MPKRLYFILICLLSFNAYSQSNSSKHEQVIPAPLSDSVNFVAVEIAPEPAGGVKRFYDFVINRTDIPEVVSLFGINGKVLIRFYVDSTGFVTRAQPISSIGLGLDSAVAIAVKHSYRWVPGRQNNHSIGSWFTMSFNFNIMVDSIQMKNLEKSSIYFLFEIDDKLYNIKQASSMLGKQFSRKKINEITPYINQSSQIPTDKETAYLIKIASNL